MWPFNTINRLRFWIQRPTTAYGVDPGGNFYNFQVGTYVKEVTHSAADAYDWSHSDEFGGNHYYHLIGLPNFGPGTWTQVILNMHPDHRRGDDGGLEHGVVQYPTATDGENGGDDPPNTYNYFDTLTRLYLDEESAPATGTYRLDEFEFYRETAVENDYQVYSITSTYVPHDKPLGHHLEAAEAGGHDTPRSSVFVYGHPCERVARSDARPERGDYAAA